MGEFKNRVPKMRQKYVKKTLFKIEIISDRIVFEISKKKDFSLKNMASRYSSSK